MRKSRFTDRGIVGQRDVPQIGHQRHDVPNIRPVRTDRALILKALFPYASFSQRRRTAATDGGQLACCCR